MLEKSVVERVLEKALESGGDFAEIFVEKSRASNLSVAKGKVDASSSHLVFGAGIRLFKDEFYSYATTNDLSEKGLMLAAKAAADAIVGKRIISKINLITQPIENNHQCLINPNKIAKSDKVDLIRRFSELGYKENPKVSRVDVGFTDKVQEILVANSEGVWAEDKRIRSRLGFMPMVEDGEKRFSGSWLRGMLQGYEMTDDIDIEAVVAKTVKENLEMLYAKNCPAGKMPVVLAREIGGVLFHEASGHALEATSVARKASVFTDKIGEKIASPLVTLVDDGTIPNYWGSTNIDDEGMKTQRNVLIEKGVLKNYLVDKFNSRIMKMAPTGSGRRESYDFAPTSRMNNTFIMNGDSTPEEVISNTEHGIYAAQISGGSVNDASGDFNFSVSRAYLIENGKITEPVKGAKLIGSCGDILQKVDMVGNDLKISGSGQCGSKSGWVPVCQGTPTMRVASMTVGGQK